MRAKSQALTGARDSRCRAGTVAEDVGSKSSLTSSSARQRALAAACGRALAVPAGYSSAVSRWVVIAIVAAVVAVEFFVFGAGSIFWGSILLGMIVVVFAETMRTR